MSRPGDRLASQSSKAFSGSAKSLTAGPPPMRESPAGKKGMNYGLERTRGELNPSMPRGRDPISEASAHIINTQAKQRKRPNFRGEGKLHIWGAKELSPKNEGRTRSRLGVHDALRAPPRVLNA